MAEVESRTQGSRPRPGTQKNPRPRTHLPRTDPLEAKDRIVRGQSQGHSAEVFSKKKSLRSKFSQVFRKLQAISKKQKKSLRPQIRKFATNSCVKNFFSKVLWRAPKRNNIAYDIGTFSTDQKIVLSSSRELLGIFEDLQGSKLRPRTSPSRPRPRTSNCVLEAKYFKVCPRGQGRPQDPSSVFFYTTCLFFRFCI